VVRGRELSRAFGLLRARQTKRQSLAHGHVGEVGEFITG
jgi:hypothetical protein